MERRKRGELDGFNVRVLDRRVCGRTLVRCCGGVMVGAFRALQYLGRAFGSRESQRTDAREHTMAEVVGEPDFMEARPGHLRVDPASKGRLPGLWRKLLGWRRRGERGFQPRGLDRKPRKTRPGPVGSLRRAGFCT